MRTRTKLVIAAIGGMLCLLAHLANTNVDFATRLNLLEAGVPFASVRSAVDAPRGDLFPGVMTYELIYVRGKCVGYVDTGGDLVIPPASGPAVDAMARFITLVYVEIGSALVLVLALIFCCRIPSHGAVRPI